MNTLHAVLYDHSNHYNQLGVLIEWEHAEMHSIKVRMNFPVLDSAVLLNLDFVLFWGV